MVEILQTLLEYGGEHAHDEDDGPHEEELPSLVKDVPRARAAAWTGLCKVDVWAAK